MNGAGGDELYRMINSTENTVLKNVILRQITLDNFLRKSGELTETETRDK